MKAKPIPDSVRSCLRYDPETGALIWIASNRARKAGDIAGSLSGTCKYLRVNVDGRSYLAHRLAWFLYHGEQPNVIDHINHDRLDNRIANLRSVDSSANNLNRRKSYGVIWHRQRYGHTAVMAKYKGRRLYYGKSVLLAWFHRIMAEREDHPLSLRSPHGEL